MIKKFDKNKSYIFSRERYIETSGILSTDEKEWYNTIDGVEVEVTSENTGKCGIMLVIPEWSKEVDTEPKVKMEVSQKELNLIIKSLDYLNNNDYFMEEVESELAESLLKKLCNKSK